MNSRIALKMVMAPDGAYPWHRLRRARMLKSAKVAARKREKARRRLRELGVSPSEIRWEWCGHCERPMVRCPDCGNNTCNGGNPCRLCYEYEAMSLEVRGGKPPVRADFPDADAREKEDRDWLATWTDPDFAGDDASGRGAT